MFEYLLVVGNVNGVGKWWKGCVSVGNFERTIEAIINRRFHRFQFLRINFDRLPRFQLRIERIAKLDPFRLVELGLVDGLEGSSQSLDCVWSWKSVKLEQTFALAFVELINLRANFEYF